MITVNFHTINNKINLINSTNLFCVEPARFYMGQMGPVRCCDEAFLNFFLPVHVFAAVRFVQLAQKLMIEAEYPVFFYPPVMLVIIIPDSVLHSQG